MEIVYPSIFSLSVCVYCPHIHACMHTSFPSSIHLQCSVFPLSVALSPLLNFCLFFYFHPCLTPPSILCTCLCGTKTDREIITPSHALIPPSITSAPSFLIIPRCTHSLLHLTISSGPKVSLTRVLADSWHTLPSSAYQMFQYFISSSCPRISRSLSPSPPIPFSSSLAPSLFADSLLCPSQDVD